MILEIEGKRVEVDPGFAKLTPEQQEAEVAQIAKSLVPAATKSAPSPDKVQQMQEEGAASVVYPVVGGLAATAAGMGSIPERLAGMVRDPVTGKWMALENYGRQMFGGKWYGGANLSDVYQRGYKATGDVLKGISPDPVAAAQYEAEALKNASAASRLTSKTPAALQGLLNSPLSRLGRGVVGIGAGMQGADAVSRYNRGDIAGSIISGLGALGTGASMIPHPIARVGGTALGLGAEGLNMFLDSLKNQ